MIGESDGTRRAARRAGDSGPAAEASSRERPASCVDGGVDIDGAYAVENRGDRRGGINGDGGELLGSDCGVRRERILQGSERRVPLPASRRLDRPILDQSGASDGRLH